MWFFSKKTSIAASGILSSATDHHSHILPGVDDGVETIDEALRILATYETLGIKTLWLTPHIMEDCPNSTEKLRARFERLKAAYNGSVELHLAAEYMIDNHLRKLLDNTACHFEPQGEISPTKDCPSLQRGRSEAVGDNKTSNSPSLLKREYPQGEGDENNKFRPATEGVAPPAMLPIGTSGKHILVETSYYNAPIKMRETLQQIKSLGYHPLLAHPERYMYLDNAEYTRLHSEGVRFQLNLASLAGGYGPVVKKKALWLLTNGLYTVAGTDLHSEDSIEYITNCKLSKQEIEQVEHLLHKSI